MCRTWAGPCPALPCPEVSTHRGRGRSSPPSCSAHSHTLPAWTPAQCRVTTSNNFISYYQCTHGRSFSVLCQFLVHNVCVPLSRNATDTVLSCTACHVLNVSTLNFVSISSETLSAQQPVGGTASIINFPPNCRNS